MIEAFVLVVVKPGTEEKVYQEHLMFNLSLL